MRQRRSPTRTRPPALGFAVGFTLVELLIVMVIIGIIVAFIMSAAMGGIRQAEERATQALIVKLDAGLADRVDALLTTRADYLYAHYYMAAVANSGFQGTPFNSPIPPPQFPGATATQPYSASIQRAQIIARFDQIKAELPDVFVVQTGDTSYPINFAAVPYPGTAVSFFATLAANSPPTGVPYGNFLLPLGAGVTNDMRTPSSFGSFPPIPITAANAATMSLNAPYSTGIFGASYTAAGGIYKSLIAQAILNGATAPKPTNIGYDGVDNDGNGLVDDLGENGATIQTAVVNLLKKHTHKTARAEMLYALLVEGQGPLGSVFSRDDFSDKEVRDTDGDGLPEFVDAWGEPIQFYRWPIFFRDDLQKHGALAYGGAFDNREQNPLDPNQQLLNPSWWGNSFNDANPVGTAASPLSGPAALFQSMFIPLTDPNAAGAKLPVTGGTLWDRGGGSARRAFFSKFLIISGGPDKTPGVPVLDPAYYSTVSSYMQNSLGTVPVVKTGGVGLGSTYSMLNLLCEGQAAQGSPNRSDAIYMGPSTAAADYDLSTAIQEAGNDDITSHSVQGPGGAIH